MKLKIQDSYWYGAGVALFVYLFYQGPIIHPDSNGYLAFSSVRSLLYPLFTFLCCKNLWLIVFFQLTLGFTAIITLTNNIKIYYKPNQLVELFVYIILFSPYYFGATKFGNSILSEGLCYPLFLFAITTLLQGLHYSNATYYYKFFLYTALLILCRRQFLFLYPLFLIIYGLAKLNNKKLIAIFFISIIATNLTERTHQYIQDNNFKTVPFTGIQLITMPLYIADDKTSFDNPLEQQLFTKINNELKSKKLKLTSPDIDIYEYAKFYREYNDICWRVTSLHLPQHYDIYQQDALLTSMAWQIIKSNFKLWSILYYKNILYNIGGYYVFMLLVLTTIISLIYKDHLLATVLIATAGNYSLIALVEPVMRRYSSYSDTILFAFLLVYLGNFLIYVRHRRNSSLG